MALGELPARIPRAGRAFYAYYVGHLLVLGIIAILVM